MDIIDYDSVAELYDVYADTDYDFEFFTAEINKPGLKVLELTSGTGRLSIPLVQAGAELTCVDASQAMLDELTRKLREESLTANIVCADVCNLPYDAQFDLAFFPFQSFMELVGEDKQRRCLSAVYAGLKPGGRFICTLHNPEIRKSKVTGNLETLGSFPMGEGTLTVSGVETGGEPVVSRDQYFEYFDTSGRRVWKRHLLMAFQMIAPLEFLALAEQAGFQVDTVYGNYDRSEFDHKKSPVMIWVLRKEE